MRAAQILSSLFLLASSPSEALVLIPCVATDPARSSDFTISDLQFDQDGFLYVQFESIETPGETVWCTDQGGDLRMRHDYSYLGTPPDPNRLRDDIVEKKVRLFGLLREVP